MNEQPEITELPKFVTLCCIGYDVTVHECMIIFEEKSCVAGRHCRIVFERAELNGYNNGCWYVRFSDSGHHVMVDNIIEAHKLVVAVYGDNFQEKKKLV